MLGRIKNLVNKIPEQYIIPGASPLASYPSIINEFKDLLTTHKFFAQIKSPYRNDIINTCIDYSKTKNCSYNIRKKRHILEFDESKVSNFLVFMLGTIHSCLDDVLYTCYYVATIDIGDDVIIAIPKTEPNHSKAIEDKLNEYVMSDKFELWGDFNQVYNFSVIDFISYVNNQKKDEFRRFIPRDYKLIENEEYAKYQKRKELEEELEVRKKFEYSNACNEEINDTFTDNSEPTTEEISEILLRCIAQAYMAQKIPNTTDNDFYIYTKCKKHNKLICFNHQEDSPIKCVIDLIEEAGMHDKIADIKELALSKDIGISIKELWKKSNITHCTTGYLYSQGSIKVLALICESLKPYFEN